jgi:hypothetical protein
MTTLAAPAPPVALPPLLRVGRSFVHPAFDLLLIGGGLSLVFTAAIAASGPPGDALYFTPTLALIALLANSAHFAASTVRLYTKPGAARSLRFLTLGFPLVSLVVLTLAIARADLFGRAFIALYVTWSPFHYGAQAYGLALMYAYRSGCTLDVGEKRVIRAACLLPFFAVLVGGRETLVDWLLQGASAANPGLEAARVQTALAFGWATLALLAGLSVWLARSGRASLPLISLCVVASNCIWLVTLNRMNAFVFATFFHGIQYLAIVTIFHVKDRLKQPGNTRGWAYHAGGFYLACLGLGYLLFQVWPYAYVLAGFGLVESALMVTAAINLHHFIVDAFIWKLRQDANYRIVTDPV